MLPLHISVGQNYLRANPLLERPLALADIKPRLLGHWGTTPGLNLLYVHLDRVIVEHDLDMIVVAACPRSGRRAQPLPRGARASRAGYIADGARQS